MGEDWSIIEVEIIVRDYFSMLAEEIAGLNYSKAAHRRSIRPQLQNRSEQSLEFKHRNKSAVLVRVGEPYINGYKPAWNYQKLLEESVIDHLRKNPQIETLFKQFAENASLTFPTSNLEFDNIVEAKPEPRPQLQESEQVYQNPIKVNYIELEQANKLIGSSGEKIVLEYERWRLIREGKEALSEKIEWVAETQGDGFGYDILSKNTNGSDRYIEVKSTKLTKDAPIFFTKNEYDFSNNNRSNYFLYRVFNLRLDPKLFIAQGTFDDFCSYKPVKFKGNF